MLAMRVPMTLKSPISTLPWLLAVFFICPNAQAQTNPAPGTDASSRQATSFDEVVDRAISNEHMLVQKLKTTQPMVETYVQQQKPDSDLGSVPHRDFYFLARIDLTRGVDLASYIPAASGLSGFFKSTIHPFTNLFSLEFFPRGFAARMFVDSNGFDRAHYTFQYNRREFLGDVRCMVIDVKPRGDAPKGRPLEGRFEGRIWVEDRDYNVVRFEGTNGAMRAGYLHFDSWRVNGGPHLWLPAAIYTEETSFPTHTFGHVALRAQTRLWSYEPEKDQRQEAFTNLTVDIPQGVKDQSEQAADPSPVEAQRMWQLQAEDNIVERLQRAGLVSPIGEVDKVLDTVLNNLEVSNNLPAVDPPIRVRILLTTPLESMPVGHTIVVSRGLIDVLPNEACLAAVLAHELAHIMLGHSVNTQYAFADRLMFDDKATLKDIAVARDRNEEAAADQKAMEILKKSPYNPNLRQVGLFLRMLSERSDEVPHLIKPLLGNRMADTHRDLRLSGLMEIAPELQLRNTEQVAALPLGSRVVMNPWSDQLRMSKARSVPLLSAKEKLPFQIAPFMLHLTREDDASNAPSQADMSVNAPGNIPPNGRR